MEARLKTAEYIVLGLFCQLCLLYRAIHTQTKIVTKVIYLCFVNVKFGILPIGDFQNQCKHGKQTTTNRYSKKITRLRIPTAGRQRSREVELEATENGI